MGLSQRVTELLEKWLGNNSNPANVQITQGGNTATVIPANGTYGLTVITPAHVCTNNSTNVILLANQTFTGIAGDVLNHGIIVIMVKASHNSAIDGLKVQFSVDGINWDSEDNFTITGGQAKTFSFQCSARYYRVIYINGVTNQTYFRLQSILKPYYVKPSSHRIADTISSQDDAELIKSVLTAENETGFINIQATKSNNLMVTDAENSLAIAKGEVIGHSALNKFGNASDFDTTDGYITVWDGAEDGTAWELMKYVYSTTNDIDSISSSDIADSGDITIIGLDINYNLVTQTINLNGRTRVALTTPLIRVFRAYNSNGVNLVGHIIIYVNTALTNGVPTDKTKIRAIIDPESQQTLMCVYTIPAGYTGYLKRGYASTSGASKSSQYIIRYSIREFGKVFRVQNINSISDVASSALILDYDIPQKILEKTDLEVTVKATEVGATGCSISAGFDLVLVQN